MPAFEGEAEIEESPKAEPEVPLESSGEPEAERQADELIITIPHTEYVKAGYFGMSSYTIYCLKTRVRRGMRVVEYKRV